MIATFKNCTAYKNEVLKNKIHTVSSKRPPNYYPQKCTYPRKKIEAYEKISNKVIKNHIQNLKIQEYLTITLNILSYGDIHVHPVFTYL